MGLLAFGALVSIEEGDYEGRPYYGAVIRESIEDAEGNEVMSHDVKLRLDKEQFTRLRKHEGENVLWRVSPPPAGKLPFSSVAPASLSERLLTDI